ncbi:acyltransferase [Streptomyces sp. NPDC059785]|uniref:acyltransferase family protein n=1 Tax=Streptomyces sp. NPDC059785 TaxID=3346945 RepID=UPI003651F00B
MIHHAAQPYGPADWWYVEGPARTPALAALSAVDGSFFMSLFFFVSAVLVPGSHRRHGTRRFLTGRLIRLGIPVTVGALTIVPGLMYAYYVHYRAPVVHPEPAGLHRAVRGLQPGRPSAGTPAPLRTDQRSAPGPRTPGPAVDDRGDHGRHLPGPGEVPGGHMGPGAGLPPGRARPGAAVRLLSWWNRTPSSPSA